MITPPRIVCVIPDAARSSSRRKAYGAGVGGNRSIRRKVTVRPEVERHVLHLGGGGVFASFFAAVEKPYRRANLYELVSTDAGFTSRAFARC
jgi:hypothetical protein